MSHKERRKFTSIGVLQMLEAVWISWESDTLRWWGCWNILCSCFLDVLAIWLVSVTRRGRWVYFACRFTYFSRHWHQRLQYLPKRRKLLTQSSTTTKKIKTSVITIMWNCPYSCFNYRCCWNSSVGIETGYGLEASGSIPDRLKNFLHSVHSGSKAHPASYPIGRFPRG
jgi:hypothetical protein